MRSITQGSPGSARGAELLQVLTRSWHKAHGMKVGLGSGLPSPSHQLQEPSSAVLPSEKSGPQAQQPHSTP